MTYGVYPQNNPNGYVFLPAGDLNGDGSTNVDPRVGMLTGIAGVVRVRDNAALAFGANGANISATGYIQTPNAALIVTSRTQNGLADIDVLASNAANEVVVGGTNGTGVNMRVGANLIAQFLSTGLTMSAGTYIAMAPSNVATTGDIRGSNAFSIFGVASGVSNFSMMAMTSAGAGFGIGGSNVNVVTHSWTTGSVSTIGLGGASANRLSISQTAVTIGGTINLLMGVASASLANKIFWGTTASVWDGEGSGSPEGVHAAPIGSTFRRRDGGAGTTWYVKESSSM